MRTHLAKLTGKLISKTTRTLKLGGGSAAPGLYALKIDPNLIENLIKQIPQNIVITGTNGKTTTSKLIDHLLTKQSFKVIRNSTGSNLERGIASALIHHTDLSKFDVGVWELDEAAFKKTVFKIKPKIIIFLNAFRDQLDRYGEVDSVTKSWQEVLSKIDWNSNVLVNSSDTNILDLRNTKNPNLAFYQFNSPDSKVLFEKQSHQKSADDFSVKVLKNNGLDGFDVELLSPSGEMKLNFPLPGSYQLFNLAAALGTIYLLNVGFENLEKNLSDFQTAFGRVEKFQIKDHEGFIFLIKNPSGATAVFETIKPEITENDRILIALNDNFADGTDVSWIWDANFELLSEIDVQILCSGTRAADLAVRLKYAGIDSKLIVVQQDLKKALKEATAGLNGRLFIFPTYTALLELQRILVELGIKKHYWKEEA